MRSLCFPLYHTTVGFDRLFDRFDRASGLAVATPPLRAIENRSDDHGVSS
jgi:hypothetical protein